MILSRHLSKTFHSERQSSFHLKDFNLQTFPQKYSLRSISNNSNSENNDNVYNEDSSKLEENKRISIESSSFKFEEKDKTSFILNKLDKEVQTSFFSANDSRFELKNLRWLICLCDCVINIAKYYCMDTPQALQTYFSKEDLHLSSIEYNHLYSIFAYFFIIMFFSGYFIDKYGIRLMFFLYTVLCFVGHGLFTLGGSNENYVIMLFGRCIFGISSFCLEVCQDMMISEWFFDCELALALGMRFTTCRIGSALTIFLTPKIMIFGNYYEALSIGLWLSLFAIVCSLVTVFVDRNFEEGKGDIENLESFLMDLSFIENGIISWRKLKEFGLFFWLMVLNIMFIYACYFGFVNNSNDILCSMYGYTPQYSGELATIMYFSASLTPIFGMIIDKIGRRVHLMMILLVLLSIPYFTLFFMPNKYSEKMTVINLIFIGVFFSSYVATIWSVIPLLVEPKKQCRAFGIICSSANISLIMASIFVGVSIDVFGEEIGPNKYTGSFFCMIFCLIICFILVVAINNKRNKIVCALNSFTTNQEIRNIINSDPLIGQQLLEIIEETERDMNSTIIVNEF